MNNHQEKLDSYFKKLSVSSKKGAAAQDRTSRSSKERMSDCATTSRKAFPTVRNNKGSKVSKGKDVVVILPDEILVKVFGLLPPRDLLTCSCVCRRWLQLAGDNLLWQPLYERFKLPQPGKPDSVYTTHAAIKWKSVFMERCVQRRNARLKHILKKKDPYTGLPANTDTILKKLGVKWYLILKDTNDNIHIFPHSDVSYFNTSVTIRWYSDDFTPIETLQGLDFTAEASVLFDKDGSPIDGSPQKKSLLVSVPWKGNQDKILESDDDTLNMRLIDPGVILTTWKDGGGVAFVSLFLHKYNLVERCLLGNPHRTYQPVINRPAVDDVDTHYGRTYQPVINRPAVDDVDTHYGLHGFNCNIELRQQRVTCWNERFTNLHCPKENIKDGYVIFTLIHDDDQSEHSPFSKRLCLPWKTDLFKGIYQGICVLDVTLYDEFSQPFWCICYPVQVLKDEKRELSLAYQGEQFLVHYSDEKGKVDAVIVKDEEENRHLVTSLILSIQVEAINSWFSTSYG